MHSLTQINSESLTGLCSVCGSVRVYRNGKTRSGTRSYVCGKRKLEESLRVYVPRLRKHGVHFIEEVDPENQTGICRSCGPVDVFLITNPSGSSRYGCSTKKRSDNLRNVRGSHGLRYHEAKALTETVGCCAICGATEDLVVDHDHDNGTIRGVLCQLCNRGIGQMEDSPDLLRQAIIYLEKRIV